MDWDSIGEASAVSGANSAFGIGESLLGYALGFSVRDDQANTDFNFYRKKSYLDWDLYSNYYAPLNQQLQQQMFDYTSAGNLSNSKDFYDYTLNANNDNIASRKQALIAAGYNPILAVNGGVSSNGSVLGSTGQLGALQSPHSASGVSTSGASVPTRLGRLDLRDYLGALASAAQTDRTKAETDNISAQTEAIRNQSKLDAVKAKAALEALLDDKGDSDFGWIDDKGFQDLKQSIKNRHELDRYLNALERQLLLDSVEGLTDVANSASGVKRAFKPVQSPRKLSETRRRNGNSSVTTYEYGY